MYKLENNEIAKFILAKESPQNNKDFQNILIRILNKLGDVGKQVIADEFGVSTIREDSYETISYRADGVLDRDEFVTETVLVKGMQPTMDWGGDLDLIQESDPEKIIQEAIDEFLDSCGESIELAHRELITLGYGQEWIEKLYQAKEAWKESRK